METYNLKIKNIRLYTDETVSKVTITFEGQIPGIIKTESGEFVHGNVDHISMKRNAFTAQVCDANPDIALLRACRETPFTQKDLAILFMSSVMKFNSTLVSAGELIDDVAAEHDFYSIDITDVRLSPRAEQQLHAATTLD